MVENNILQFIVRKVDLKTIFNLRHETLRQGLPEHEAIFEGDNEKSTYHFAAYLRDVEGGPSGNVVCCSTFVQNKWEERQAYQLRGMATYIQYQGQGVGKKLLVTAEAMIRHETNIHEFWCNARQSAIGFYEKLGWSIESDIFLLRDEPHVKMYKLVQ